MSKNKIVYFFLILSLFFDSCKNNKDGLSLQNGNIKVEFFSQMPVFKSIIYSKDTLCPRIGKGLTINGELKDWSQWNITSKIDRDTIVYTMNLQQPKLKADFLFWLDSNSVRFKITRVIDKSNSLKEIGLQDQPWVSIKDSSFKWWTVKNWTDIPFVNKKINNRGIGFYNSLYGKAGDTIQQKGNPFYACIWQPQKFCITIRTSMNVYPLRIWSDSGYCNLAPNKYYYNVKSKQMPDYEAQLTFIGDINSNNRVDVGDYFLWCNRQMKRPGSIFTNSIWYKIFLNERANKDNPCTTLKEAKEIITFFKNITDGIPQIIYLVGWQYDGHDTGYHAMDKLNARMGTKEELYSLSKYCDSIQSVLSAHINIDDAYKVNKYFSNKIMALDYDHTPMFWQYFGDSAFHISHYKDVATGSIFTRLEQFSKIFPLKETVHIDAMRVTNANPDWEKEDIGVLEEYELGLKPIMEWFNKRGIFVTTETQNGNPIDLSPLVVGMWTYFWATPEYQQIYHGKIVGGGIPESMAPLRYTSGLGNSITQDFSYRPYTDKYSFVGKGKDKVKQIVYLSAILYQFFLTKEMLEVTRNADGYKVRFSDNVTSTYDKKTNHLEVTWNNVVIADNDERFIPIHGGIYAYSKNGTEREWLLPENYRNANLKLFELTENGRKEFKNYKIKNESIILKLTANQSVKILRG